MTPSYRPVYGGLWTNARNDGTDPTAVYVRRPDCACALRLSLDWGSIVTAFSSGCGVYRWWVQECMVAVCRADPCWLTVSAELTVSLIRAVCTPHQAGAETHGQMHLPYSLLFPRGHHPRTHHRATLCAPCVTASQPGWMNRGPASQSGRLGNPKITGSSQEPADSKPGWVKPKTLILILVASWPGTRHD